MKITWRDGRAYDEDGNLMHGHDAHERRLMRMETYNFCARMGFILVSAIVVAWLLIRFVMVNGIF